MLCMTELFSHLPSFQHGLERPTKSGAEQTASVSPFADFNILQSYHLASIVQNLIVLFICAVWIVFRARIACSPFLIYMT